MQTQSGFVEVNGGRLYYDSAGAGEAVVLIHGFSLDTRMWDDQFEALARHYRVIRFDVRGFGRSPAPTQPYSRVADLRALLDHLDVERAHIIGLSMGGGIAIDFALAYPPRTRSLVPVDSMLGGFRLTVDVNPKANEVGIEAAKERWLAHPLFATANRNPAVAPRLAEMVAAYSGWHWVNRNPDPGPDVPAIERLGEMAVPTLVIVGEHDLPDFRAIADTLRQKIPGARQVVLPGAGHLSNMEAPEAFNRAVLEFLDGL